MTDGSDAEPPSEEELDAIQREIEQEQEDWDPLDLPDSQAQLVNDLTAAGAPDELIARVGAGAYHDYVSPFTQPKHRLVIDCQAHGLHEVAERAKRGDYDP